MTRHGTYDDRRAAIVDSVLTLAAEEGLDAVSLRAVAARANVSMGRVQHYFPAKADLMACAIEHAIDQMSQRMRERAAYGEGPSGRLRAIVDEFLGTDPHTSALIRVSVMFMAQTMRDARIAGILVRDDAELKAATARTIADANPDDPSLDATQEAEVYWMLLRQLATDVAFGFLSPDSARETFRYHEQRMNLVPPDGHADP